MTSGAYLVKRTILLAFYLLFILLPTRAVLAQEKDWQATVNAANKEGKVVIYAGHPFRGYYSMLRAFKKTYPGIEVKFEPGRGSLLGPKILAERRAGKFIPDIFIGGKGSNFGTLYLAGITQPIAPHLSLPDVVDESKWWKGEHKYLDPDTKNVFVFVGNAGGVNINYNTKLVDPKEFKSYRDLLNPKWKGKIAAMDPRMRGADTPLLFMYYMPTLGPEFMRQLYGGQNVTISRDYRQPIDWLARGKFSICIPCASTEVGDAIDQGLPLGQINTLKEGGTLSSGGHTMSFLKKASHPNAAKIFMNWLLSRDAQMLMQMGKDVPKRRRPNSLRIDISKDMIPEERIRVEGRPYFDGDNSKFVDRRPADRLLDKIFRK